jgi:hypothetical protein
MPPTLADFEVATRVRYAGAGRGPGRALTPGTVIEAAQDPDTPDGLRVSVLWDDQDNARPYTVTPDTLHLWMLLPPPRVYAADGASTTSAAELLIAADVALADARSTHTARGKAPDLLEALADRLRDLGLALHALPFATDDERTEAGEGDALDVWRMVAGWYAADAAAAVWDAWQRETHASHGSPDPVPSDVSSVPLTAAEHALFVAHHTLDPDGREPLSTADVADLLRALAAERNQNVS